MPNTMLQKSTVPAALALGMFAVASWADRAGAQSQPLPPVAGSPTAAPKQAPAAKPSPAKGNAAQQPAQSNEQALRQRVEQLEEQLVDLQVVIGTLESLAKAPAAQGAPTNPADAQRIQALEAQLKSLSGQIEQLGEKVRGAGEPTRRSEAPAPAKAQVAAGPAATSPAPQGAASVESFGSATVTSAEPGPPREPAYETAPGSALPPIGEPPSGAVGAAPGAGPAASQDMAAVQPPGDPKHDYEVAYSYVIQRDYGAAQAGFTDFMKRYPKDALVPNALYWLGETHYQQRNFADAAEAFDLVTRLYASSPKAADSQLKRALSFSALGKNNEACAALSDLDAKFESAPAYVKTRAGSERRRLGCTG